MRSLIAAACSLGLAAPAMAGSILDDMTAHVPAPEAGVEVAECVVNVAWDDTLNVRTGPGTKYAIKFAMPPNVCGVYVNWNRCSGRWCRISYNGRTGWAHTRYLG